MQINSTGFATKYKTISFRFLPAASDMLSLSCGCNGKKGSIFLGGTTKNLKMDFTWLFNEFLVLFFLEILQNTYWQYKQEQTQQ